MSGGGVFNINSQQAVTINNVARDQTIGRQDATLHAGPLGDLAALRAALAELSLPEVRGELPRRRLMPPRKSCSGQSPTSIAWRIGWRR